MERTTLAALGVVAVIGTAIACDRTSSAPTSPTTVAAGTSAAAADGSTLKVNAPTAQSPINDARIQGGNLPTLSVSASTAKYGGILPTMQYHFQVFDAAGNLFSEAVSASTSWIVTKQTDFDKRYTWWARAESGTSVGPWSSKASFLSPNGGYISGSSVYDPLTNGQTVGIMHGGHLVPGQGWQADSVNDGLDYPIATCNSCKLEFDITNQGNGLGNPADLKWLQMGDGTSFNNFSVFRDNIWKMHLEQRGDGDGSAMKIIWRNGANGPGQDPGDHVDLEPPSKSGGPEWHEAWVYHFVFEWWPDGFQVSIGANGGAQKIWFQDSFRQPYAPPNHTFSLGCRTRGETEENTIWRNLKVTPH